MSDLLTRSDQSLILQSHKAKEREEPLNGDGFGVGWYAPEIDLTPCVFTSITPAWSSRNLHRLAEKVRSTCFFAHVRAASPGSFVSEVNCHPFQYEQFLWMHNGAIGDFSRIRRRLRSTLSDDLYNFIQGTTDSEHAFAVFLSEMVQRLDDYSVELLRNAMEDTIRRLADLCQQGGVTAPTHLNFAVTDGQSIVVTRCTLAPDRDPPSLYLARGDRFTSHEGVYSMSPAIRHPRTVIIASEPLTAERSYWEPVPRNHLVVVTPELHVTIREIRGIA